MSCHGHFTIQWWGPSQEQSELISDNRFCEDPCLCQHMPFPLCVSVFTQGFSLLKEPHSYWIRTHPSNFTVTCLCLQRPSFQVRSYFQILAFRTSTYPLGKDNSIPNNPHILEKHSKFTILYLSLKILTIYLGVLSILMHSDLSQSLSTVAECSTVWLYHSLFQRTPGVGHSSSF